MTALPFTSEHPVALADWLDVLRCPAELAPFQWRAEQSTLECSVCGQRYPVVNGIVVCVKEQFDDLRKLDEMKARDKQVDYYDHHDSNVEAETAMFPTFLQAMQPQTGDTVIDLGCGTGMLTLHFTAQVARVVGVDFSFASLQRFREKLPREQQHKVLLIQSDICVLPVAPGVFDKVISSGVLHHLPTPEMRQGIFQTIARLLKPAGTFTTSFYNWSWQKQRRAKQGIDDGTFKEGKYDNDIYYYNFEAAEVRRVLTQAGLTPDLIRGLMTGVPGSGRLGPLGGWLRRVVARTPLGLKLSAMLLCHGRRRAVREGG
jgi:SAM-dependent methyltransferase